MTDESQQHQCSTRRCVLLGAGVLGAAGVLTACSTAPVPYDANDAGQAPSAAAQGSSMAAQPSSSASAAAGGNAKAAGPAGTVLGMAAEIPVGGGKAYTDNREYYNLGCATQRNLAAMVDNPADLIQPRGEGPAYSARRSVALDKYRKGENPAGIYDRYEQGKISDLGK